MNSRAAYVYGYTIRAIRLTSMRLQARVSSVCLLAFCPALVCAEDSGLDLKTTLQIAERNNLELRAARQQRAIAVAGITVAKQFINPTVTASVSRDAPHEGVLLGETFELGGKRGKRIAIAREEQKATEIDIGILERQIRQRTREAFYRVLWSREQTGQAKAALDLATRIRDVVNERYQLGDVAQLEVIQAEVELARTAAEYQVAQQTQKTADAQFAALLSRPLETPIDLRGALADIPQRPQQQAIVDTALRSNAELQMTTQDLQVEQRRLELARAQRIPNLDLQAGVDLNAPHDYRVGPRGQIGMQLPLLYRGQGEIAQSNARLELLRLTLEAQKTLATAEGLSAYFDYLAKAQEAEQYRANIVPQSVHLEDMAEESYRAGKSNLLTLIDVQRKLNETRKAYLDSLLAAQSAFAALEESVGTALD
jgi:cobalt-zinc-cadmium efflux system outer membrane protein